VAVSPQHPANGNRPHRRGPMTSPEHVMRGRVPGFDFGELRRRAERQATEVGEHRLGASKATLARSARRT
jgi:hypothetical protein